MVNHTKMFCLLLESKNVWDTKDFERGFWVKGEGSDEGSDEGKGRDVCERRL